MSKKTNLLEVRDLSIHYSGNTILKDVSLDVRKNEIFGIIGPSGSGKTSFLKAVNRMDELTSGMSTTGSIRFQGYDTSAWKNLFSLRKKMGVVFPLPVGLPLSIYENVAFAPRIAGTRNKTDLDRIVERCLKRAALWDEVKDRLDSLMLDEFSIAVDPVTTMRIEDVLRELKKEVSIILVTNLVQQAERLADRTSFFLNGEQVETGITEDIFNGRATDQRTIDYVEGRFG